MATIPYLKPPHRRWFACTLGLLLIAACENARTPVEATPAAGQLPAGITSVTSLVGEAAGRAWIGGLTAELEDVNRQIRSAPTPSQALLRRADWLGEKIAEARPAPGTRLTPRTTETSDEDAGITSYGTQIGMPDGGPFRVTAYTSTSRVTRISHSMRIVKTTPGRSYSTSVTDETGILGGNSLYTGVGVSGDCSEYTTLDAATEHTAGSVTFRTKSAFSTASASCGTPPGGCGGDGGEEGGEIMTSISPGWGPSLACGGPGEDPGGGYATYRCYTVTVHHYWYYPDTNRYEYRYSEESTWCEQIS